jgi:hypothetical protein
VTNEPLRGAERRAKLDAWKKTIGAREFTPNPQFTQQA